MDEFTSELLKVIEGDLDNIFPAEKDQKMERDAVERVITGLRNTSDKMLLRLDKSTLAYAFLYELITEHDKRQAVRVYSTMVVEKRV